jgi:hypothetical protein
MSARLAVAAQDAVTIIEQAKIQQSPSPAAETLETRPIHTKLRISSFNKDGWYKVRTTSGQFGWIYQSDIRLLNMSDDLSAAALEVKSVPHDRRGDIQPPRFYARAGGSIYTFFNTDLNEKLGLRKVGMFPALGYFADFAIRLEDRLKLAARFQAYAHNTRKTFGADSILIEQDQMAALLGLRARVTSMENFDIEMGLYGGVPLKTKIRLTATDYVAPNFTQTTSGIYTVLINASGVYRLSRYFSVTAELGLLASKFRNYRPRTFLGDSVLRNDLGQMKELDMTHAGPLFNVGLQFQF